MSYSCCRAGADALGHPPEKQGQEDQGTRLPGRDQATTLGIGC